MTRILAILIALLCGPVYAASLPATPATFAAVFAAAKGGDTITLGAATYPLFRTKNRAFTPPLTIDATGATTQGVWYWSNIQGVVFKGGAWQGIRIDGCARIAITGIAFSAPSPTETGVKLNSCDSAVITGNSFDGYHSGAGVGVTTNFLIADNACTNPTSDCYDVGPGSAHGDILRNSCVAYSSLPGAHPDCIQAFPMATYAPISDLNFVGNVGVGAAQCIFVSSKPSRLYPAGTVLYGGRVLTAPETLSDGGYDRIKVQRNACITTFPNGISLVDCRDCAANENTISTGAGAPYVTKFSLDARVAHCGNIMADGAGKKGFTEAPCLVAVDPALLARAQSAEGKVAAMVAIGTAP